MMFVREKSCDKALFPSFEEGKRRRSNNVTLLQEIGAAGRSDATPVLLRLSDRFEKRLDVLV